MSRVGSRRASILADDSLIVENDKAHDDHGPFMSHDGHENIGTHDNPIPHKPIIEPRIEPTIALAIKPIVEPTIVMNLYLTLICY